MKNLVGLALEAVGAGDLFLDLRGLYSQKNH